MLAVKSFGNTGTGEKIRNLQEDSLNSTSNLEQVDIGNLIFLKHFCLCKKNKIDQALIRQLQIDSAYSKRQVGFLRSQLQVENNKWKSMQAQLSNLELETKTKLAQIQLQKLEPSSRIDAKLVIGSKVNLDLDIPKTCSAVKTKHPPVDDKIRESLSQLCNPQNVFIKQFFEHVAIDDLKNVNNDLDDSRMEVCKLFQVQFDQSKHGCFQNCGYYLATGDTCLHLAARCSRSRMLQFLLDFWRQFDGNCSFGEMLSKQNGARDTALHLAVQYNHVECVQLLIDVMPKEVFNFRNHYGEPALVVAAKKGNANIVDILAKASGFNLQ